jgi:hypothetical protein
MFKGATHIHSTYSDGDLTLPELRDVYRAAGCAFLFMTDHAESFHPAVRDRYVEECRALSGGDFLMVPGLEFACIERMHVLGLGVTAMAPSRQPAEVIEHIERQGGLSVIAHPRDASFSWIESLSALPSGLEVWNTKYDGRYAPRVATFDLLARLRRRRPDIRAFYGQDYHWKRQHRGLFLEVEAKALSREALLSALRRGTFRARKGRLQLSSSGELTPVLRARFEEAHMRSERIRRLFQQARGLACRWGMTLPSGLKAELRRIF